VDTLRLAITPADSAAGGGFQVQVYVNEVEVTEQGAGLGMDPYDVLVPVNRFVARDEPHLVPVARCGCGVYGCGMTDAAIAREGDRVRWDWKEEVPMSRPVLFDADAYDREVTRVAQDHSWETPERTAGRLVLSSIARDELPSGLRFDWVGNDWRDSTRFQVCLQVPEEHQVFIDFDWDDHSPESLASEVRRVLTTEPPARWRARWHSIQGTGVPPAMAAGPGWTQARF
jgi:hypothetical protein